MSDEPEKPPAPPPESPELKPAHPEDPFDLDFTSLFEGPARESAHASEENEARGLIGARALGEEGFHVVVARPHPRHALNRVILVVDDDAPTAELAAHTIREAGYHSAVATTLRDAARHMSRLGQPALVLLDVEMPEMSGFEFLARLRAHKKTADTPVILFTAHSERRHIVRGLQAGADGYIAKPVSAQALIAAIRTVIGD